jgi:hypothetical protein
MKTNMHFFVISRSLLRRTRNVSDKTNRENQNTFCVQQFFFLFSFLFKYRAVYEKMRKSIVEGGTP